MTAVNTKESKEMLAAYGWDTGIVFFGLGASENSVRVLTMLEYLRGKELIPTYKKIAIDFNAKPIDVKSWVIESGATKASANASIGKDSAEWAALTDGKGYMPALAIDGTLYTEASQLIQLLNAKFPSVVDPNNKKEVEYWLEYLASMDQKLFHALKHWGWSPMHGNAKNYKDFGYGKKDIGWERQAVLDVDTFFKRIDAHIAGKEYMVGGAISPADFTMINWALSFTAVVGLNVEKRYPEVWRYHLRLKKQKPPGSNDFYTVFPMFGGVLGVLNLKNRGGACWKGNEFHIEMPIYWELVTDGADNGPYWHWR